MAIKLFDYRRIFGRRRFDKVRFRIFSREFFYMLTIALVIFGLLELVWPGSVLTRFNYNWLLLVWLVSAAVLLI